MNNYFYKLTQPEKWRHIPAKVKSIVRSNLDLVLTSVETEKKIAALTFDDGPNPDYTPKILDLLDRYGAHATFFEVGESAKKYSSIIHNEVAMGHAVGNHTWNHSPVPLMGRKEKIKQIKDTQKLISFNKDKLFRPPWGFLNLSSYIDIKILGYTIVYWSLSANDWKDLSSKEIFQCLDSNITPGSIILMHDNIRYPIKPEHVSRDNSIKALEIFLQKYNGTYDFVTIPQLLTAGKPIYKYGLTKKKDKPPMIPDNQT